MVCCRLSHTDGGRRSFSDGGALIYVRPTCYFLLPLPGIRKLSHGECLIFFFFGMSSLVRYSSVLSVRDGTDLLV